MTVHRDTLALEYIVTDKDTHFTGALAQNAIEVESIDFPADWSLLESHEIVIESIVVQSDQNLEWDIYLWSTSDYNETNLDADRFIDSFNFPTTAGKRIAGAGQYYYSAPSNNIMVPYKDEDRTSKLHIGLVNRSATAKNAGATGEIVVKIAARPVYGV